MKTKTGSGKNQRVLCDGAIAIFLVSTKPIKIIITYLFSHEFLHLKFLNTPVVICAISTYLSQFVVR